MREEGGCMVKIAGEQLIRLISQSKEMAGLHREQYLDRICEGDIDDCAVLNIQNEKLLFSTDFGPLVGKDLADAGKIAALNAISDIYAMGGIPKYALIQLILGGNMTQEEGALILSGVYKACKEEGVSPVGGHSIVGNETYIGLSVLGKSGKGGIIYKKGARSGSQIWLSKPIGTGLVLRGYYHKLLTDQDYKEAAEILLTPNRTGDLPTDSDMIYAMTDITGYGFLGHLTEMLEDGQGAELIMENIPFLDSIKKLSPNVMRNEYIMNNVDYASRQYRINTELNSIQELALFDPQTNGPILVIADPVCDISKYNDKYIYVGKIIEEKIIRLIS